MRILVLLAGIALAHGVALADDDGIEGGVEGGVRGGVVTDDGTVTTTKEVTVDLGGLTLVEGRLQPKLTDELRKQIKKELRLVFATCFDADGRATESTTKQSSGVLALDMKMAQHVGSWRVKPAKQCRKIRFDFHRTK